MDIEALADARRVFSDIKARAARSGVTLGELCAAANVSKSTLDSWNAKRRQPSVSTLIKINSALRKLEKRNGRSRKA